ncbi:uncharacterized protein LOC128221727 [Mya arenaria]|uniref:uncharacterized protein LOC128221727 n=1 Tax=Mya arenaria TaxID=6604 RepID=UPI0022E21A01|nr:uncharacterized protein LOC128221727 [Mya arenaria]
MPAILVGVTILWICAKNVDSLQCYSCDNAPGMTDCNQTVTCNQHQSCSMFVPQGPTKTYTLSCMDNQLCQRDPGIIGKRQSTACHECCAHDLCNTHLCSYLPPTACHDDESFDCPRANTLFGICNNVDEAKKICPNFCGICPVDGQWANWSEWTSCDVTCDQGKHTRTRTCTNPEPKNNGSDCVGVANEYKRCDREPCPVHGGWSTWLSWGSCSVSCGIGIDSRDRTCTNPKPDRFGDHCFGKPQESRICTPRPCRNGEWSAWEQWAPCPVTCGFGVTSRDRKCNNPAPSLLGQQCDGDNKDWGSCFRRNCPINNCLDIRNAMTGAPSGVYTISTPVTRTFIQVYCHMDTAGGGWTVFQRRFNGSLDFYKNFQDYEDGFGSVDGEHWLGLRNVYELTTVGTNDLRIDVMGFNGSKAFEVYSDFLVGQGSNYTLHLGARTRNNETSGNVTMDDSSFGENDMAFSAKDKDMDNFVRSCAASYHGGWWMRVLLSSLLGYETDSVDNFCQIMQDDGPPVFISGI